MLDRYYAAACAIEAECLRTEKASFAKPNSERRRLRLRTKLAAHHRRECWLRMMLEQGELISGLAIQRERQQAIETADRLAGVSEDGPDMRVSWAEVKRLPGGM